MGGISKTNCHNTYSITDVVNEYLENLKNGHPAPLPYILIELYIGGDDCPLFCGNM